MTLSATADSGESLADPVIRTLGPGASLEADAASLFVSAPTAVSGASDILTAEPEMVLIGSLRAESEGPGMIGDVLFGDSDDGQFAAALPLQVQPFREAVFNQVANLESFFTGLAFLLNPGLPPATVSIQVIRADGSTVGEADLNLAPGKRISRSVNELVPESAGQAGGYVRISTDQPVIAQVLFGCQLT